MPSNYIPRHVYEREMARKDNKIRALEHVANRRTDSMMLAAAAFDKVNRFFRRYDPTFNCIDYNYEKDHNFRNASIADDFFQKFGRDVNAKIENRIRKKIADHVANQRANRNEVAVQVNFDDLDELVLEVAQHLWQDEAELPELVPLPDTDSVASQIGGADGDIPELVPLPSEVSEVDEDIPELTPLPMATDAMDATERLVRGQAGGKRKIAPLNPQPEKKAKFGETMLRKRKSDVVVVGSEFGCSSSKRAKEDGMMPKFLADISRFWKPEFLPLPISVSGSVNEEID